MPTIRFALALLALACAPTPPCTDDAPFSVSPVSEVDSVTPLGLLSPPSHTLPTDHVYLHVPDGLVADVVAPGALTFDEVSTQTYLESPFRQGETDFTLSAHACRDVSVKFSHLASLDPTFVERVGDPHDGDCTTRSTADETIENCTLRPGERIEAGEPIGTAGGPGATSPFLDFGAADERVTLAFANPARVPHQAHVVCPLDLFSEPTRGALTDLLLNTSEPRCGTVAYDVPGTAAGNWFAPDIPTDAFIEGYALALVYSHLDPSRLAISIGDIGTTADAIALIGPTPEASGSKNRRFEDVTPGAGVFCYDGFDGDVGVHALIEVTSAEALRIETAAGADCGEGPWTLSDAAISMER